jgi:hypothetical protein
VTAAKLLRSVTSNVLSVAEATAFPVDIRSESESHLPFWVVADLRQLSSFFGSEHFVIIAFTRLPKPFK